MLLHVKTPLSATLIVQIKPSLYQSTTEQIHQNVQVII